MITFPTTGIALLAIVATSTRACESQLPNTVSGVFSVEASVVINASVDRVWETVLDFPKYGEWNPFVRSQVVTNTFLVPTADQAVREGSRLVMTVQIPPLAMPVNRNSPLKLPNLSLAIENITHVDPVNHRVAWKFLMPSWLLGAERWQVMSEVGEGLTWYETREVFVGVLAGVVERWTRAGLEVGFEEQGRALKSRVEGMAR